MGNKKVWDMDTVSAISEIEMEHKMSDDMEVQAGDKKSKQSVIAPLIEEAMETDVENKCKRCLYALWRLSDDDNSNQWLLGLHLLNIISVGLTLSMWIYFW